MQGGLSFFGK